MKHIYGIDCNIMKPCSVCSREKKYKKMTEKTQGELYWFPKPMHCVMGWHGENPYMGMQVRVKKTKKGYLLQ